ncbi:MAG: TRIC cation channel family protein, partial [Bacteroidota bacterium]
VIRDVLLNKVPLLFQKDIYALACVAGGGVYFICDYFNLPTSITEIIAASTVIAFRLIAVRFHIHLPQLPPINSESNKKED